jgi:hypothetical protein
LFKYETKARAGITTGELLQCLVDGGFPEFSEPYSIIGYPAFSEWFRAIGIIRGSGGINGFENNLAFASRRERRSSSKSFIFKNQRKDIHMRSPRPRPTLNRSLILLATLALTCSGLFAADGVDDMIKMSRAGVSADVLLAYVQDTNLTYDLSADEIQTLQDSGVPSNVIVAMLDKGKNATTAADMSEADAQPVTVGAPPAETADASATVVAPPADDANISYFYEALAPDGRWQQDESLGWVWQPTVVTTHTDWRPYCNDGHWVWTDQGWFFENDYRWGWAAFHYGRWHHHDRMGWVWQPDTEWAPAWVSWRHSDSYYGWAPLPPDTHFDAEVGFSFHSKHVGFNFDFGLTERDYTFVPSDRFLEGNLAIVALDSGHSRTVFKQTTIVNNTYVYNDNRVINNGVPVHEVAQRTNRKIEAVKLADAQIKAGDAVRGEARTQNTIAVYRPKIAKATPKDPNAAIAHSTYVKREPGRAAAAAKPARAPINTMSESAAKARLAQEVEKRRSAAAARSSNAAVKKEDADQKRLDAEVKQREARDARDAKTTTRKDDAEQKRLDAEVKQREARDARDAKTTTRKDDAEQKRLDAEVKQREARDTRVEAQNEAKLREEAKVEAAKKARDEAAQQREAETRVREQSKAEAAQQRQQERATKVEPAPAPRAPAVEPAPKNEAAPKADARNERVQEREQAAEQRREEQTAKRDEKAAERAAKRDEQKDK